MAGKSNRGKNKKGSHNNTRKSPEPIVSSDAPVEDIVIAPEPSIVEANGVPAVVDETSVITEPKEVSADEATQGDLNLFPVPVKTQGGEKLELQLNPGDSVMDVRQFLLDAPDTCFFTCYDLLLHTKDGSVHHLEDFNEISEVADITAGACSLEMVAALYDDRSIRAHVHRTRELLSLSSLHVSLSTSLALQHETAKNSGDAAKVEVVPELDGLGFMEDVTASLSSLLSSSSKEIKSVESIVFSSFNPPPRYRRLVGDLIYLDVITLEGNKYCITGTTKMFYVNSSTGNTLDPRTSKGNHESPTLVGLLQKISSKFKKAFREILDRKATAHPFEIVQSLLPPTSWLGTYPVHDHIRDAARAEAALNLSFGSELIGMQRDWNEELQSCREFPHTTPQERILRDRALYKVTSDFVDAATSGAVGVISRCIPPINPTDPECFHMYVHNNIFFSFAIDADLDHKSLKTETIHINASDKASSAPCEVLNGEISDASNVEEKNAETLSAESEQATYASANNDLKGTMAFQEADVPGLYNLAMAIIDYRGHRVVAQSVLPGILQGDKSDSLLYGSVDNGKKICWNEDFHSKVLEAAKRLHLKEHTVLDASGNAFKLAAPVECKGIVGSDDRHYLLDLMRVTPRDANYTGSSSRFCILRPELVTAFCQKSEAIKKSTCEPKAEEESNMASGPLEVSGADEQVINEETVAANPVCQEIINEDMTQAVSGCASARKEGVELCEEILFNPNVFTEFKVAGSDEELATDVEDVRKVSLYLSDVVIPKFIEDLCSLEVSPMDSQTLTEALHAHGINVRYVGKIAERTKHLSHLWDLCSNEIVLRSAKHILRDILRDTEDHDLGPSISHFFNCFFGSCDAVSVKHHANNVQSRLRKKELDSGRSFKEQTRSKSEAAGRQNQPSYMNVSSENLWSDISEFSKAKYQFELGDDAKSRVKKVSVIRNMCQKVGVTLATRKYDLESATPFQASDILDVQPVVKHSVPVCSAAKDLVEMGKVHLAEGMLGEAYTFFSEAFAILQQVTGPMHREVANCCRYLAMVLYHAGDMAGAIMQQHKELIINERCLGLDHPDTAHSYGNMALFYHGRNQTELALRHMSRALLLLSLSSGPDHPDVAATFINVAMMYQDIEKMDTALRYLQEALKKNEKLLGEGHIQTAVCYHALAIAFNCMGAFKLSVQHETKTYDILVKQLGEDDSRTHDSQNWLKTFKIREAQKQKGQQALNPASAQKAVDILKANPDLMQALHAAAASGGSGSSNASTKKSFNNAMTGEALPRGRGVDERGARAAAEIRKKAAAKGLVTRPHGTVPLQASTPPLSQLLNIINSGETNGTNTEVRSNGSSNGSTSVKDQSVVDKEEHAPVGLGKGLGSLDGKKQKSKPKAKS